MSEAKPLVVCIAGSTATGKTDAAVAVCRALGGEVISMDSMQIYAELSIGTAKPTAEEMGGIRHHLIGYVSPGSIYSVAEYQQDANRVLDDLGARAMLPVFCGGTGLYLQAVSHPLRFADAGGISPRRAALAKEAESPEGAARLHARLAAVDPATAARLHVNNTRRVVRALEIYETTGEPMSARVNDWDAESVQDWLIFGLTMPRDMLYRGIEARVDRMIARGWVDEVRSLLAAGVSPDAQSMQAIGYREIVAMLRGAYTLPEAVQRIKMNTRRYAKRQLTWFRRDTRVRWLDRSQFDSEETLHQEISAQIQAHQET